MKTLQTEFVSSAEPYNSSQPPHVWTHSQAFLVCFSPGPLCYTIIMCVCVYSLWVFTCTSESALTGWSWNQVSLPWYFCRSSFFTATLPTNTHEHKKTKLGSKYNSLDASYEACMSSCKLKQTPTRPHMLSILTSISFLKYVSSRCWNAKAHSQWPWNDPVISTLKLTRLSSFCPHPPTVKHARTVMVLQIQISPWEVFSVCGWWSRIQPWHT